MIELFAPLDAEIGIRIPAEHRRRIGMVGAGAIVDVAHLPAYRAAGLEVVAITDLDQDRARDVARRHGIPRVVGSLDKLLADPEVEVVDIAVPSSAQPNVFRRVVESGRHVLAQKPFAPDVATASSLSDAADAAGVHAAVNQQLRYDEGVAAAHAMAAAGWLGTLRSVTFTVDIDTDWAQWEWAPVADRLEVLMHSIHYHDAVRWFLGDAHRLSAVGQRGDPTVHGETRTMTIGEHRGGAVSVVSANHGNHWGDPRAEFRVEGDRGVARGTLGLLLDYPAGRPDTLEVISEVVGTDGWVPYPVTRRWIPDAFAGPMAGLLAAIAGVGAPRSPVRENVGTIATVERIYTSMNGLDTDVSGAAGR